MRATRRRRRQSEPANHERWLVSYADFITLLFAFFTTMYAISTVDAKKLSDMVTSLDHAFPSARAAQPPGQAAAPAAPPAPPDAGRALAGIQADLERRLAGALAERRVEIERQQYALIVTIRELDSFRLGSAELSPAARDVLTAVGATLAGVTESIRVEGHTDDLPIHSPRFRSNWELSTARATTVVQFLIESAGIHPERLSAAGYASYRPRTANETDAERARNRRVDIVILAGT